MFEVIILAIALSMDAFAVSIGLGSHGHGRETTPDNKTHHARFPHLNPLPLASEEANESLRELQVNENTRGLGLKAGLFFGTFQALMPFIGYLGGRGILSWVDNYAHWIAFALLTLIGGKMIYEGLQEGIEEDITAITNKLMLLLAIATSIDAMAAGFSLTLLNVNAYLACLIIGMTTFAFSWAGVLIGRKSGTWLESRAEIAGGVVLILMGIKILMF
ncbi:MAG: manganese efflux pump MntP family protein [Gallionella sp.]|jgi:putative Mn2+ efflux pump MntP